MQNNQLNSDLIKHIELSDNILGELSCTGHPYLELNKKDHNLSDSKQAHADFFSLLKAYAYKNDWELDGLCFFDVCPVFSTGKKIPSIMGLHLSLILFDSGIAGTSSSLYFDTKTNWNKFTKATGSKIFKVSSWCRVEHDLDAQENNAENYLYVKTSINLIKHNQLCKVDLRPENTNYKILNRFKNNSQNEREILDQLLLEFLDFIEPQLERRTNLVDSIKYLFLLITCWFYSFNKSNFKDLVSESLLKFDFESNEDIYLFTTLVFAFLDHVNIDIGLYAEDELTRKQFVVQEPAISLSMELPSTAHNSDDILDGLVQIDNELLHHKNNRFYRMLPPLEKDEILQRLYESWAKQVKMFFLTSLTTETYDVLRSYMHFYVDSEIKKHNIRNIKNLDLQLKAIENCAYSLFQHSFYQAISPDNAKESPVVQKYFKFLVLPDLTEKQNRDIHILNSREQDEYKARLILDCRMQFSRLIDDSLSKITHPSQMKKIFKNYDDLPETAITQTVFQWYSINYLDAYLKITRNFKDFCAFIEKDVLFFSSSEKNRMAMGNEIEYFLRMYQNPQKILDINDAT